MPEMEPMTKKACPRGNERQDSAGRRLIFFIFWLEEIWKYANFRTDRV